MQTEAEKYLIAALQRLIKPFQSKPRLLNIGAAGSVVIEKTLWESGARFVCDRSDIQNCRVKGEFAGQDFICPIEDMSPLGSDIYDAAFANFVLEHISDPAKASKEMYRVLKPGGYLVLSLSNPRAPEFKLAKVTSTHFHQLFRQEDHDQAYPVKYAYGSIPKLKDDLQKTGFKVIEDRRFAFTYGYLYRWPLIKSLSRFYDLLISKLGLRAIMSHAVLILEK